jgi:HEAT repeats
MIALCRRRARFALVLAVLAPALLPPATVRAAAQIFDLADRSEVVAWGTVEGVQTYKDGKFQVFSIQPAKVLKGRVAPDATFRLVQERLFEQARPYFGDGTRTMVFAIPLPSYTLYKESLPAGSYLQWTERLDTAEEVASLRDPALVEPVASYLASHDDPEVLARLLGGLTASNVPRLHSGALAALEARPELAPLVDAAALASLPAFLADGRVPLASRGETLVRLARIGAAGVGPIAEAAAAEGGPLLPAAVDALVTLDRPPPRDRLLTYTQSDDEALRLAAARGLAKDASPPALDRLAAIVSVDPSEAVRIGVIQALPSVADGRVVAILAKALAAGGSKRQAEAAGSALATIGTPPAIAALEHAFEEGDTTVKVAAAFSLKQSGTTEGVTFLKHQEQYHPDPQVRRLCKLALGESMHEH